ncbi:MAG: benzoate-CoA ligase family protein [Xanthobacteraceae bacterium]|nr:MAG: benzoate-CoA ligase family protein [Xanthobacteraceae bacterium]
MRMGANGPEPVFPSVYNVASDTVDRHLAEGRGAKTAIQTLDETITYETLVANIARYGHALLGLGLVPGDRVLMIIKDSPEFIYTFWACVKTGLIPIALNTMLTPDDYKFIIADSEAKLLVYSEDYADRVLEAASHSTALKHILLARHSAGSLDELARDKPTTLATVPATPDAECLWLYSSGTTGRPKGVVHIHRDVAATAMLFAVNFLGVKEQDVFYSIPRLFFALGLGLAMNFPLWIGGTTVLDSRRPLPEIASTIIKRFRPTIFTAVPTFISALLAASALEPGDVTSLRCCISSGEALPEELQRRWRKIAPIPITDAIGSTEALHTYISNKVDDVHANASGKLVPGYQARILDNTGEEVADGDPGRLWIKGPSITRKYWNNPEKTASSLVNGWLDTGDTYRRENGVFYYCGRNDDMLKVGGIWVSPFEIEGALIEHPDILEAAVVGRADEANLVKPEAWVVLRNANRASEKLAEDIRAYCKSTLAPYKYPRWIHFVETLPKTATGKIQRFKLRHTA